MLRRLVLFGLLVFGSCSAQTARAQTESFTWQAPAGCLDRAGFEQAFLAAVGASVEAHAGPETRLAITFTEGWSVTAEVEARGVRRVRTLHTDETCHALDDGLVVVVALLVEDVGTEVARIEAEARPLELDGASAAPSSTALRGALAVGGSMRVDMLPGWSVGPSLGGELRLLDLVTIGLEATYFVPLTTLRTDGVGAEASAVGGALHGCLLSGLASFAELGGCARVTGWAVTAAGQGLASTRSSVGFGLDATLTARLGLELATSLWLRAEVGLGASLVRTRIYYELSGAAQTYHLASILFPMAALFFEVRMGP